jgi:hypothetical protein
MAPVVRLSGLHSSAIFGSNLKGPPTVSQNICKEGIASHACENEQKSKDELSKQQEVKGFSELKGKFSNLPAQTERTSWFQRLVRRSGA